MNIPFAQQAYQRNRYGMPPQECLNLFHETAPIPGKASILLHTPALDTYVNGLAGGVRAIMYSDGTLSGGIYVIAGDTLYTVAAGVATSVATGLPSGTVKWAASAIEIAFVVGTSGYVIDGGGLNAITDPDFPAVSSVAYINGYFLWTSVNGQFIWSEILDGQSYDALDFATAEKAPDELVGIIVDNEQILLFGTSTFETWVSTGNSDSAFEPIPGGTRPRGAASRDSIVQLDNTVFFVGNDKLVYRLEGLQPRRISQFGVEEKLSNMNWSNRGDLAGAAYAHDGHTFYALHIPGEGTYCYDVATNTWHQRRSWQKTEWAARHIITIEGETYAGDPNFGRLYTLNHEAYEDVYGPIERMATAGVPSNGGFIPVHNLTLDLTSGNVPLTGQGSEPEVMLSYSDDLGNTYSSEVVRSFGKTGEYRKRPTWHSLGMIKSPGRVYKFRITDPVPVVLYGARQNVPIP